MPTYACCSLLSLHEPSSDFWRWQRPLPDGFLRWWSTLERWFVLCRGGPWPLCNFLQFPKPFKYLQSWTQAAKTRDGVRILWVKHNPSRNFFFRALHALQKFYGGTFPRHHASKRPHNYDQVYKNLWMTFDLKQFSGINLLLTNELTIRWRKNVGQECFKNAEMFSHQRPLSLASPLMENAPWRVPVFTPMYPA